MTEQNKEKTFRTLSDVMDAPAGDGMETIARIAPAIEKLATKSGLLDLIIEKQGTAETEAEAVEIVKGALAALMKYGLGECLEDMVEVLAAINGRTVEELKADYTGWDVVRMAKAVISDKAFFSLLRTLLN